MFEVHIAISLFTMLVFAFVRPNFMLNQNIINKIIKLIIKACKVK